MCHKLDFKLKYLLASTYNGFEEKPVNSKHCTLGSLQNSSTNFPIEEKYKKGTFSPQEKLPPLCS